MRQLRQSMRRASSLLAPFFGVLVLASCGLPGDPAFGDFASLGPPAAPVHLYYEDVGHGPPILLIHGFGASTFTWHQIIPDLARGHRVIAVDMKGFGKSDKPLDEKYSALDQEKLLAQLIEEKNLHNLTVVGHSFGGGVALALVLDDRLKGRISRLVLIDSIGYPQKIPIFFKLLEVPGVAQLGVRMVPPTLQAEAALKIAYYDSSKITPATVEAYSEPLKTAAGKHAIIYTAREIVPPNLDAIAARYSTIMQPTLIMWCDHDRIVPLDIGLKLRRAIPHSTLKLVQSCGHIPQEEQPQQTLEILQDFLDQPNRSASNR
jgi:pimeloyl-ACP methyl ester carboxylesterase